MTASYGQFAAGPARGGLCYRGDPPCALEVGHDGAHSDVGDSGGLLLEKCVCGRHSECPDDWHYGDDLPCSCTPAGALR